MVSLTELYNIKESSFSEIKKMEILPEEIKAKIEKENTTLQMNQQTQKQEE